MDNRNITQTTSAQPANPSDYKTPLVGEPGRVVIIQNGAMTLTQLPRHSTSVVCPSCRQNVLTRVSHEAGLLTFCASGALCFFFFPLFWLPCCVPGCKDAVHYCPNCGAVVGTSSAC